jgi:hypothetical protein
MNPAARELRLPIILLWIGVATGAVNLLAHAWLTWQITGQMGTSSPLVVSAALFIFVQGRLILRLKSCDPNVRNRLLMITVLRIVLIALNLQVQMRVFPALVVLPIMGAMVQLAALGLIYTPPASQLFARRAPAR